MANESHVTILKQGAKVWNQWRKEEAGDLLPDLTAANLREEMLIGANLLGAKLCDANFEGATLRNASFTLAKASGANFASADLRGCWFAASDISRANFFRADLNGAILRDAVIDGAIFGYTTLVNADLTRVKGLDTIIHNGPSHISIETLYLWGQVIPEQFLYEAGIPASLIVNLKSLVAAMEPIQFYSCFISHSSRDAEFAMQLHNDLRSNNVPCWFAPEDLKIGDRLRPAFDEAIHVHDKLMVIISENSVKSTWVEKEVGTAFEKERQQNRIVLFPIRLDDIVMNTTQAWAADIRRTRHIGDFRDCKNSTSYKKSFDRLLRDLKAESQAIQPQKHE